MLPALHDTFESSRSCLISAVTLTDIFLLVTEVHLNRRAQPTSLVQQNAEPDRDPPRSGRGHAVLAGRVAHRGMEKSLFVFNQDEVQASEVREGDLQRWASFGPCGAGPRRGTAVL